MSWNYRVVRLTEPDGRHYYEIREAYYPDLKSERPWTITANSVRPGGSTLLELRKDLALMLAAFDKAPLNDADFPDHAEPLSSAALAGSAPQPQPVAILSFLDWLWKQGLAQE